MKIQQMGKPTQSSPKVKQTLIQKDEDLQFQALAEHKMN